MGKEEGFRRVGEKVLLIFCASDDNGTSRVQEEGAEETMGKREAGKKGTMTEEVS
jgi:hypothetical protein